MAEFDRPSVAARPATAAVVDEGLRSYMLRVYNYMGIGLVLTGIVAYFSFTAAVTPAGELTAFGAAIFLSPLRWIIMLAPLAFVLVLSFGINRMSVGAAQLTFWAFAAVMGLSLSWIFLAYTATSIAKVFFISAATFGVMSLYGYTTKRDISSWGSFLLMGLFGIIIASLVNVWLVHSAGFDFAITIIGVLVFVGLTAWRTQMIKESYSAGYGADVLAKSAINGALGLYLDFINLFLMLLRLFGNQRN